MFNEDEHFTRLYFEKYLPLNPMFPAAAFIGAGIVASSEDIMPRHELIETRFYKEWIEPQGIADALSVNLEKGTTRASMINVRTSAIVTPDMRQRMGLLAPHLQRAVAIGQLFDQNETTKQALTATLDHVEAMVLLVAADGAIAFANEPARAMLAKGDRLQAAGNVLRAVSAETNRTLREIFASAAKGDASVGVRGVAVPLSNAKQERWFAHVLPLTSGNRRHTGLANHAVAAILIRQAALDSPPPLETLAGLHKLTASEVRVLDAVLKVNGVKAMADLLGLSQATIKTHLHNLFRKTGTRRQSDLVKLVTGIDTSVKAIGDDVS
jgi:DNA-binding NarL/FixJ family response regulator